MAMTMEPGGVSIDTMIGWLRRQRIANPTAPLTTLVDVSNVSIDRLTDLACIDLIERCRLRMSVRVETMIGEMPAIANHRDAVLDLIDAEICVRRELGDAVEFVEYQDRFPDLAVAIGAMMSLQAIDIPDHSLTFETTDLSVADLSVREGISVSDGIHIAVPIEPPAWFSRGRVISQSESGLLMRGRDSHRGAELVMKIVHPPQRLPMAATNELVAQAECASLVRHPAWVGPDVAAVEPSSIATIRVWIVGMRWDQARMHASTRTKVRDLATIGYAIQSAHDTVGPGGHACHGAIHLNNLFVDTDNRIRIVDAFAGCQPSLGVMYPSSIATGDPQSRRMRRRSDVLAMCALVRLVTGQSPDDDAFNRQTKSLDRFCQRLIADPDPPCACGHLADRLLKLSDDALIDSDDGIVDHAKRLWRRMVPIPFRGDR